MKSDRRLHPTKTEHFMSILFLDLMLFGANFEKLDQLVYFGTLNSVCEKFDFMITAEIITYSLANFHS